MITAKVEHCKISELKNNKLENNRIPKISFNVEIDSRN